MDTTSDSPQGTRDEYLPPYLAARLLGVTPSRVRDLRRAGVLRAAIVTPDGRMLFRRSDVEALAAERAAKLAGGAR